MADLKRLLDALLIKNEHVCPWWLCFTFDNPLRELIHDPLKILSPYVQPGATVVDIGPGRGCFTIPLCRLVGDGGRVVAVDIQPRLLRAIERRAGKAGVSTRLTTHLSRPEGMGLDLKADFALAFWMVHEVPDKSRFFREIRSLLKQGGLCLLAEPKLHVSKDAFAATVASAVKAGFTIKQELPVAWSRAVLLSPAEG